MILVILHILIVPESPRWLAQNGKANLAWKTLRRMRRSSAQTRHELRYVYENAIDSYILSGKVKILINFPIPEGL